MGSTSVAQLNVRLPRDLKDSGDVGLRMLGLSPSEAVRALWRRLSCHEDGLASAREFLLGEDMDRGEVRPSPEEGPLGQGWRLVDACVMQLGLSMKQGEIVTCEESDEELVALALEERMRERTTVLI